ncbi:phosphoesterase RecJ-like protein [Metamycoplasma subdolum]|uniref:Phosphoesterase RecJ-like protein n=1 Tax=Metamycoplasma subdolum TaxID=92407 RepID=A0A3M0A854_9BACT|nr:bifunctional oligoribonuclease/PAP phosphatase NrnA [Metamycoplasma subdolum]RMA78998.1 phosphoesterase RecJ-like protein [Metamycoplasma subdolum]WPB50521.1 bifunctional oligoribonuclease/PAP phosphatase NrnA [Metamycoplasma subdolum]
MLKITKEKLALFKKIENQIKSYKNIIIYHHIRPDGDCLGSQRGLKKLIEANFPDKKVYAIGDSKNLFPYLDLKMDKLPEGKIKSSLAIIVDANFKERLECREYLDNFVFDDCLRIDHHPNEDDLYASIRWVEPEAPAAAQQVTELAYFLNWKMSPEAATALYLGIYTDSVRLTTGTTNAKTLNLVAYLWENGAKKDLIHEEMAKKTSHDLKIQSFINQNMKINKQVVSFYFSLKDQKKLGINDPLQANRPFALANIDDAKAWVFFTQEKEDAIRCEFRSNGACVRNVAIKWNGGGHHRASGAQIKDEKLIPQVIEDLEKEVLNLKDYDNL